MPRSPAIDAAVRVISPKDGESVFSLNPQVKLEVTGDYKLGAQTDTKRRTLVANSGEGQHVHLIVDNKPYQAIYDVSKPIVLKGLSTGPHTLVVFPSRSYHEGIKSAGASQVLNFSVLTSFNMDYPLKHSEPGLIYSRPKGLYSGRDSERIMVDFYLHNVYLSPDGYKVELFIFEGDRMDNDSIVASSVFDSWQPAFVEGLETGEYTFRLELVDSSGRRVLGRFGAESRLIKVIR